MSELVEVNGVELCVEGIGDRSDPAILLVMGASGSMDWWEDEFCERLAAGSRFVIRYDQRDTGRSVTYEPGAPGYTGDDLIADVLGVLDAFGLARAHLVGISAGGAIAQIVALDNPERIASLTLISTSPSGGDPDLPGMSGAAAARFADVPVPDWSDRAAAIDYGVHLARVSAARSRPFDEAAMRALLGRVYDRTRNMESSMKNHYTLEGGERWRERLAELRVPTLVMHGDEDPLFPPAHGVALANEIPGATLIELEGMGHELPERVWDVVIPAILEHTSEN
jgi:pimeloyl-ACP methyl ester carboxylesterase